MTVAPIVLRLPYVQNLGATERELLKVWNVRELAAVEIGPDSDVDAIELRDARGARRVVCIGAPAVGPLLGPIEVRTIRHPFYAFASYAPCHVELIGHLVAPGAYATRRAPKLYYRGGVDVAVCAVGDAASYLFDAPMMGRKRLHVAVENWSASLDYTVRIDASMRATGAGILVPSTVVPFGETSHWIIEDEPYHALSVLVARGAGAGVHTVGIEVEEEG